MMEKLEVIKGDIEEESFRIFDNDLFNLDYESQLAKLNLALSLVEGENLSEVDAQITNGLKRAVESYFPLRRFILPIYNF